MEGPNKPGTLADAVFAAAATEGEDEFITREIQATSEGKLSYMMAITIFPAKYGLTPQLALPGLKLSVPTRPFSATSSGSSSPRR